MILFTKCTSSNVQDVYTLYILFIVCCMIYIYIYVVLCSGRMAVSIYRLQISRYKRISQDEDSSEEKGISIRNNVEISTQGGGQGCISFLQES